ncbi:MAG: hypothetical protein M1457_05930 [bacterium]|nr:hypothetical protein [bacterium]
MRIIGIHDGHNAAACLLEDGVVTAAVQEERLSRVKNHDVFPARAVAWLLGRAGCGWEGIDAVAIGGLHQPAHRDRAALIEATRRAGAPRPGPLVRRAGRATPPVLAWHKRRHRRRRLAEARAAGVDPAKIVFIEHHACHAAAAYWAGPWRGEPVLVLTADGAGDGLCATAAVADESSARPGAACRLAEIGELESPALVYLIVTTLLGMVPNEHEYKLMGLAPYAPREAAEEVAAVFDRLLEWDPIRPLVWRRRRGVPGAYFLYPTLRRWLEPFRFDVICGGLQLWIERLLTEWVRRAVAATGVRKVALAGGIFMNVKANQAIAALPEVEDLFVLPSCGDETNALGAAFAVYDGIRSGDCLPQGKTVIPPPPIAPLRTLYWGEEFGGDSLVTALAAAGDRFAWERPADMAEHAAEALARGEVVARFAGRAEFGARALGNRSILADPSRPGVVRTINDMIKSRDFWMPFACSILNERAADYLVNPKGIAAPWMILTFDTVADPPERRAEINAGTHPYDGTVRPQIVSPGDNPAYYELLRAFERRTGADGRRGIGRSQGIGALLNTSFNLHGHPIVNTPAEALAVMERSGLRYLILGDYWVRKREEG